MISLAIRAMVWAIASLAMLGTMLAVALVNLPVLLLTLLIDRRHFNQLLKNWRSSYGGK